MAFDAGKFLKTPDLEGFDNLKKEELVLLAKHLKLDFKVSMRKQIIKNLVIDKLVDTEILGEEALELKVDNIDAFKLKQLELEHELKLKEHEFKLKQAELEMKERLEIEKKEKEDDFKLKELEMKEREKIKELEMRERLEMEKLKIEMVKEESNTKVQSKSEYFDAAKNIRLVPDFGSIGCYRVVASEAVVIPPRSEIVINGTVCLAEGKKLPADNALLEANEHAGKDYILTARTLVRSGEKVPVRLMNTELDPKTIYPGTTIAQMSGVEQVLDGNIGSNEQKHDGLRPDLQDLLDRTSDELTSKDKQKVISLLIEKSELVCFF
ncbi:Hypothetical predicted protein [Mytilus galloprovincialis]|uniref:Uncharacterized protein n=1 Tax=Mytilus galloprovincialis TaxID=29158 RepID=A0A8B6D362_MYTGA|nr:Hypothetical predicted protein [Mytilus galloprovincialis]